MVRAVNFEKKTVKKRQFLGKRWSTRGEQNRWSESKVSETVKRIDFWNTKRYIALKQQGEPEKGTKCLIGGSTAMNWGH